MSRHRIDPVSFAPQQARRDPNFDNVVGMKNLRMLPALILLALAGCSGNASDSGADMGVAEEAADQSVPMDASGDTPEVREVITTGSLTIVVDAPGAATEEIVAVVEGAGGRVDSRSETAADGDREASARLTVRVPADELTETINELETIGETRDVSLTSDDVTRYGRDLDARIGALEASTDRLIELMAEADSSEALIAAESALSERQADLEALRSEREYLSDQVAMSTLDVSLVTESSAEFEAGGFLGGLKSGWNALVNFASGALVALGAALPWAIALGVPAALIIWLLRRRRARAMPRAAESAEL